MAQEKYARRLDHNRDAHGSDRLVDCSRNLLRQALLHLQTPRERLGDPRQLRQTEHKLVRDVTDRDLRNGRVGSVNPIDLQANDSAHLARERHHVVLA